MATSDLRDDLHTSLLEKIRESRYPSIELMNRVEASLRDLDNAREYADVLREKIDGDKYPSLQLIDRLSRMIDLIEQAEELQRLQQPA